jgi:hypothetical protein
LESKCGFAVKKIFNRAQRTKPADPCSEAKKDPADQSDNGNYDRLGQNIKHLRLP